MNSHYCAHCGQKHIERLSVPYFIDLFIGSLFHLHVGKSLFKTSYLLLANPRKVIYEYIKGRRVAYYNPASLYVIFSGLYFFTRLKIEDESLEQYFHTDYFTIIIIITSLPIMASMSYFLFKNYKLNYGEHLVMALYYYSVYYLILIIYGLVFRLFNIIPWLEIEPFSLWVIPIIYLYFYTRVFNRKKIISILKILIIIPIVAILPMLIAMLTAENYMIH